MDGVTTRPTLFLTAGLSGVGKTTRVKQLAAEHGILRLTPDEWMAPMSGDSEAGGRRDILDGRMVWVAHEVLRSGAGVVLDFGCGSADEGYAIRVIAAARSSGTARCRARRRGSTPGRPGPAGAGRRCRTCPSLLRGDGCGDRSRLARPGGPG